MVHIGALLVFIPVVFGSDLLHVRTRANLPGSVRLLKANESVNPSGSDIVFSWEECVICDGYDVRLYLESIAENREIPYKLKSAVTALKITDLPPRTFYKLVVKKLPSGISSSEVSGRCYAPKAPLPIENLVARALTSSSVHLEWDSKDADGFVVRILENDTVVQEKVVPEFKNHSTVIVEDLTPGTVYQVLISGFFSPQSVESESTPAAASVETLPVALPVLNLSWELKTKLKLSWTNPASPSPTTHRLLCTLGEKTIFDADLSGSTDFVALPDVYRTDEIICRLQTWFSDDQRTKVETRLSIQKEQEKSPGSTYSQDLWCSGGYPISYSASLNIERSEGTEWFVLEFSESHSNYLVFHELQYKLCEKTGTCEDSWISLPSNQYPRLVLKSGRIKPWTPYTLLYRFYLRCYYDNYGPRYTTAQALDLPATSGSPDPVSEFFATKSGLAWGYNSAVSPDYFLLTYCAERKCTSQSVLGDDREVTLRYLNNTVVYDATIQAVALRDGSAYVSPTGMTSFVAPNFHFSENVTLDVVEIVDSPNVKLIINHSSASDLPPAVEYHIEVCGTPALIWEDYETAKKLGSNTECSSWASPSPSIELNRQPWTSYKVSAVVCHGAFDSNNPGNITLPILKQDPKVTSVGFPHLTTWELHLSWTQNPPTPSGFFISICPSLIDFSDLCLEAQTGPLDRSFSVDLKFLPEGEVTAYITPFVKFEGSVYNGTTTEIASGFWRPSPPEIR